MKKTFLILFVLLVSNNLHSDENGESRWDKIFQGDKVIIFVDLNSIKPIDKTSFFYVSLYSYNKLRKLSSGKKFFSSASYSKVKCTEPRQVARYILQAYDAQMDDADVSKGNIVETFRIKEENLKWKNIRPGTSEYLEAVKVCAVGFFKIKYEMWKSGEFKKQQEKFLNQNK